MNALHRWCRHCDATTTCFTEGDGSSRWLCSRCGTLYAGKAILQPANAPRAKLWRKLYAEQLTDGR